jgi:RNA polymerase sigma factor (sigma-70 family)
MLAKERESMSGAACQVKSSHGREAAFAETHWSLVLRAREKDLPQARQALAELCQTYWYPLYAFTRRLGHEVHDAQDLTQEFFVRFLEKDFLQSVAKEKGRFRSFLLVAMKHFLANERARTRTVKRGGQFTFVSLDDETAEGRYREDLANPVTPEKLFERSWAMTLLGQALQELRQEYAKAGQQSLFDALQPQLSGEEDAPVYAEVALRLQMKEGAVKMAALRLRRRFRDHLRAQVARTVERQEDVEDELRGLFQALGG